MRFRVLPEARAELVEAADWYDRRQSFLCDQLLAEVDAGPATIRSRPLSLPTVETYVGGFDLRRFQLKRFPYVIFVLCRQEEIVVTAIAHARRRPFYRLQRLD